MINPHSSLDGALVVDKSSGLTSAEVLRKLKRAHSIKKLGHAGTLDPMATGLLIVLLGKATRLQSEFLNLDKVYEGEIELGYSTDSDDATGEVVESAPFDWQGLSAQKFEQIADILEQKFTGIIEQVPPQISAVKVGGARAYKLAREGKKAELKAREVRIEEFRLGLISKNLLSYRLHCSSGTYVRSIARDLGEELGSLAVAKSIRRTAIGSYSVDDAWTLDELLEADSLQGCVIPLDELASLAKKFELDFSCCEKLRQGDQSPLQTLEVDGITTTACIVEPGGSLCALIEQVNGVWKLRAVI